MPRIEAEIKVTYNWTLRKDKRRAKYPADYADRLKEEAEHRLQYFLKEGYASGELLWEDEEAGVSASGWMTIETTSKETDK